MPASMYLETPDDFSFPATVYSHGWCELAPFALDVENWRLSYVFDSAGRAVSARIYEEKDRVRIDIDGRATPALIADVRHILRLDDDLTGLYERLGGDECLRWIRDKSAGRLLRSPNVWEDLVKTMCTTNCSWALTRIMVKNLVSKLGMGANSGSHAFPTPAAMASVDEEFYRAEVKVGYRAPYFVELAGRVTSGELDPESWLNSDLPTPELKKEMKKVKGVGDYAAENLLKLVGRYDGLALDSWLRGQFYKNHNNGTSCTDLKIERHYKKYGEWRGLVIWCDMTKKWII